MDHPTAEDLHPARALADGAACAAAHTALHVHLGGRLREREEARAEARARRAEESFGKPAERRLEVDEGDALVHAQSFDLLEGGRMRRVEEIAAEAEARNQYSHRRL